MVMRSGSPSKYCIFSFTHCSAAMSSQSAELPGAFSSSVVRNPRPQPCKKSERTEIQLHFFWSIHRIERITKINILCIFMAWTHVLPVVNCHYYYLPIKCQHHAWIEFCCSCQPPSPSKIYNHRKRRPKI